MRPFATVVLACACAATLSAESAGPLTATAVRVSLDGNSTLHPYTASTTAARVTALEIAGTPSGDVLDYVLQPGSLKTFEVSIPVLSLSSPKEGIDKNMHKALKAQQHADIQFRLRTLEAAGGGYRATGLLTIAGVEKEVVLDVQVQRTDAALAVTGTTGLVMTDYGVTPPKAMMGMIRTDPKVQLRFELLLSRS